MSSVCEKPTLFTVMISIVFGLMSMNEFDNWLLATYALAFIVVSVPIHPSTHNQTKRTKKTISYSIRRKRFVQYSYVYFIPSCNSFHKLKNATDSSIGLRFQTWGTMGGIAVRALTSHHYGRRFNSQAWHLM